MNEITTTRFPSLNDWNQVMAMADGLKDSKALPGTITNQAQLAMVLLAGKEAGMGVIEALNSYYIVNGKITIYGSAVLSQLKRAGYKVRWGECSAKSATVTIIDLDGDEHTETYTAEEAVATGQTGKDVWKKYGKSMLRWKALSNAVRFYCPDVLYGSLVKEDIDNDTKPDDIIEAEITNQPPVKEGNE